MRTVEIVGGPYDGEHWTVDDGERFVRYVEIDPESFVLSVDDDPGPVAGKVLERMLPIRPTPNGYRVFWYE